MGRIRGEVRVQSVPEFVRLMLRHCSAAGKTQFALQLSLTVQLPPEQGGQSGSACYITTRAKLATTRLLEIARNHPHLDPTTCGLSDIHTIHTPIPPMLQHVINVILPGFIEQASNSPGRRPIRLVVIDTLTELFHSESRTTSHSLFERSKTISELSASLHLLAARYDVAVVVLNEVTDVFDRDDILFSSEGRADVLYRDQSRVLKGADSIPGEDRKQADLGLVWANQVNARLMLSRTGRRRYLDDNELRSIKRPKLDEEPRDIDMPSQSSQFEEAILIRRLTVVFSSVSQPGSVDYVVTEAGISCFRDVAERVPPQAPHLLLPPPSEIAAANPSSQLVQARHPSSSRSSELEYDSEPNPLGSDADPFQQAHTSDEPLPSDDAPDQDASAASEGEDSKQEAPRPQDDDIQSEDIYWGDEDENLDHLYNLVDDASLNVTHVADTNVIPSSVDEENLWF
jgi:hypothetical protein